MAHPTFEDWLGRCRSGRRSEERHDVVQRLRYAVEHSSRRDRACDSLSAVGDERLVRKFGGEHVERVESFEGAVAGEQAERTVKDGRRQAAGEDLPGLPLAKYACRAGVLPIVDSAARAW